MINLTILNGTKNLDKFSIIDTGLQTLAIVSSFSSLQSDFQRFRERNAGDLVWVSGFLGNLAQILTSCRKFNAKSPDVRDISLIFFYAQTKNTSIDEMLFIAMMEQQDMGALANARYFTTRACL